MISEVEPDPCPACNGDKDCKVCKGSGKFYISDDNLDIRMVLFSSFHGVDKKECPCYACIRNNCCLYSFDLYNTEDGECLCDK